MADRLGKYELRNTIGKGASGTVYEGWDPHIARRVAIKTVVLPEVMDPEVQEQIDRFRREAQAAGGLTHPNIVGIFDYGETESVAYIVMEFVDGESLKAVLDRGERFGIPDVVRLMQELLAGLGYSHAGGVVHRDIKPANLMLTRAGQLKIADFGIARIENSGLTQLGAIMGTPAYMSPEQISGQPVDARADLYSCGVVLYQLLTGERPFEGSMSSIMQKALTVTPQRPSDISVTSPTALDSVVLCAMAKRPEDRYPNAAAFAEAIRAAAERPPAETEEATLVMAGGAGLLSTDEPVPTLTAAPTRSRAAAAPPPQPSVRPPASAAKKSSRVPLVAGVAAAAILAAGGGAWFMLGGGERNPQLAAATDRPGTSAPGNSSAPGSSQSPVPVQPVAPSVQPPPQSAPPSVAPVQPIVPIAPPSADSATPAAPPPAQSAGPPSAPPGPKPGPNAANTTTPARPSPGAATPSPPVVPTAPPPPTTQATSPLATPVPPTQPAQPGSPGSAASATNPVTATPAPTTPAPRQDVAAVAPPLSPETLASALWSVSCTFARGSVGPDQTVRIDGLAGQSGGESGLRRAIAGLGANLNVQSGASGVPAGTVNCRILDLLRSLAAAAGVDGPRVQVDLDAIGDRLRAGQPVKIAIAMPEFPAHLLIDYFSSDGTVSHVTNGEPAATPGANVLPGEKGVIGTVQEPFGTDIITAVASSLPLFAKQRPADGEQSAAYLKDLQSAIDAAKRRGAKVVGGAVALRTEK